MKELPTFPDHSPLTLDHAPVVSDFVEKFGWYSDFNFASLWGYNTKEEVAISQLFGNLVVRFQDYLVDGFFYSFLGNNSPLHTSRILLDSANKEGIFGELKLVPEVNFQDQDTRGLKLSEDRDNFDYLLSVDQLVQLEGHHFEKQRKEIVRLKRTLVSLNTFEIDLRSSGNRERILQLFAEWAEKKHKTQEESLNELTALKRSLDAAVELRLFALGLFDGERLIGFVIYDLLNNECAESHFLKYDPSYSGIKHYLHHELAKILKSREYKFINIEQDFGIEGLRLAKEACRPISYLRKYVVSDSSEVNEDDSDRNKTEGK